MHGRGEIGQELVKHPGVASVVFTGSVETGEQVARDAGLATACWSSAATARRSCSADADLERAADAAIVGCFYLAGQCCTAAERILVHRSVHDRFTELLLQRVRDLRVGDPLDEATDMGPVCTPAIIGAHAGAPGRRVGQGATIVHGGGHDGQFHEPTVITA